MEIYKKKPHMLQTKVTLLVGFAISYLLLRIYKCALECVLVYVNSMQYVNLCFYAHF